MRAHPDMLQLSLYKKRKRCSTEDLEIQKEAFYPRTLHKITIPENWLVNELDVIRGQGSQQVCAALCLQPAYMRRLYFWMWVYATIIMTAAART